MRKHTQAIGKIVSYSTAIGWETHIYPPAKQDDGHLIRIKTISGPVTVIPSPTEDRFEINCEYKLTNVPGFDLPEGQIYGEETEQKAHEIAAEYTALESNVTPQTADGPGRDETLYFDGYIAFSPIFVYEEDFTVQRFRKLCLEVAKTSRGAFETACSEFNIEIESKSSDKAGTSENPAEMERVDRSFQ